MYITFFFSEALSKYFIWRKLLLLLHPDGKVIIMHSLSSNLCTHFTLVVCCETRAMLAFVKKVHNFFLYPSLIYTCLNLFTIYFKRVRANYKAMTEHDNFLLLCMLLVFAKKKSFL